MYYFLFRCRLLGMHLFARGFNRLHVCFNENIIIYRLLLLLVNERAPIAESITLLIIFMT